MKYEIIEVKNGRWTWTFQKSEEDKLVQCGKEFSSQEAAERNLSRHLDPKRESMVKANKAKAASRAKAAKKDS